ncbi:uncharacterized protein LOC110033515 [Phalaenopsis equestris]|uniref:uncharacterized protein LOC110033515 n=1 Tax=Phalaenopsis equestris TaxID=78828 RepID=UPI0009E18DBD|nr:uncharacterized protein LOC110033515 [Phalaenopsis equestris]
MASTNETIWSRAWRVAKTLFFITNMLASLLLVCAPPLLVVLLDLLLPSTLLAAVNGPAFSAPSFASQIRTFRFRGSLVDLPLVSLARSLLILCSYLCCNGWEPYLAVTGVCAGASAGYVLVKAVAMFWPDPSFRFKEGSIVEALFLTSLVLAMAHVVVAYRTSCRERRKLVVYKIDVEAVSLYNNDFHSYHKITLSK